MLFSPWPRIISSAGFQRAICRDNSRPIEPPAPVTSTRRPANVPPIISSLRVVGSRRRRSVISTSRSRLTLILPPINSYIPGIVRDGTPFVRHTSVTRRTTRPGADGIAMMTSSTCWLSMATSRSLIGPITGHTVDLLIPFGGIVIQKGDRHEIQLRRPLKFSHNQRASIPCSNDEGCMCSALARRGRLLTENSKREARAAD